jgi:hypothetical protein
MLLALTLIVSIAPQLVFAAGNSYTDVPPNHWASGVIARWSGDGYGVLQGNGDGTFSPSKGLTLGELATILSKTFGYSERISADVTPGWADEAVEKAIAAGVVAKAPAIEASASVTREQAIKYISIAYGIAPAEGNTTFADDSVIGTEYKPYVKAFQQLGYIVGKGNNDFDPKSAYTRAEAMKVIDNTTSEIADISVSGHTYDRDLIVRKSGVTVKDTTVNHDLIIGQGIGNGEIKLDNVTIAGQLLAFGGGSISVVVKEGYKISSTLADKAFGQPLRLEGAFGTIIVANGTKAVITGKVDKLVILGNAEVVLNNAMVEAIEVNGDNVKLIANIGNALENAVVDANTVIISGDGTVKYVRVTEKAKSGVEVLTVPTKVTVHANAGSVKTKNGIIQPGTTVTTTNPSIGWTGGGYSGGGSSSATTTPPATPTTTPPATPTTTPPATPTTTPSATPTTTPSATPTTTPSATPTIALPNDDFSLYSVTDVLSAGNSIMVETTATGNAILDVRVLSDVTGISTSWESGNLLSSGQTYLDEAVEKEFIAVEVSSALPEYFVVVATLREENGNELCDPYIFIENTKAYESYESKTVEDFDNERVINLDDDDTNNFMVVSEGIPYIQAGANGHDFLDATQSDIGIFVIANASETVAELVSGDRLVIAGEDNMIYLIKIIHISNENSNVTINATIDPAIGEFVEYIKIDIDGVEFGEPIMDMSDADEGVILLDDDDGYDLTIDHSDDAPFVDSLIDIPEEDAMSMAGAAIYATARAPLLRDDIDAGGSASGSISLEIGFERDPVEISGKVELKGTVSAKLVYDIVLFGADYFECKVSAGIETEAQIKVELKREGETSSSVEINLGTAYLPTPIAGLTVKAEVSAPFKWELSADLAATANAEIETGVRFGTVGFEPFLTKSLNADLKVEGDASITYGPKIALGISFLNSLEAKMTTEAGAEVKGTATLSHPNLTVTTEDSVHACTLCVDGNVDLLLKAGVNYKATLLDIDALTWEREHTFNEWRLPLAKFFVSIINASDSIYGGRLKFGWNSECDNSVYRTIIDPQKEDNTVSSAEVSVSKAGGGIVASGMGKITKMLYPGNYIASAQDSNFNFTDKSFTVVNAGQTVILPEANGQPDLDQGILNGDVMDAETNQAISGATIKAYSGETLIQNRTTGASGSYTMPLEAGAYRIDISAPGYIPYSNYLTVEAGRTHYLETFLMVTNEEGEGTTSVVIQDAVNGQSLSGVALAVTSGWGNINGDTILTASTDSSGQYSFTLPYGNYTVAMSLEGYVTDSFNIVVKQSPSTKYATLAPIQVSGEYRVVLTWGSSPSDLDSHLTANGGVHVYYSDMVSANAWLDIDDVTSYGPETITIGNLALLGGFKFSVHDYSNRSNGTTQLSSSGATVRVYRESDLLKTYFVPSGQSGTVWNVFSMAADGRITDLNNFEYQSDPSAVGSSGLLRSMNTTLPEQLKDYEAEASASDEEGIVDVAVDEGPSDGEGIEYDAADESASDKEGIVDVVADEGVSDEAGIEDDVADESESYQIAS